MLFQVFLYGSPYIRMPLFQKDRFPKVEWLNLKGHTLLNLIEISRLFPQIGCNDFYFRPLYGKWPFAYFHLWFLYGERNSVSY